MTKKIKSRQIGQSYYVNKAFELCITGQVKFNTPREAQYFLKIIKGDIEYES